MKGSVSRWFGWGSYWKYPDAVHAVCYHLHKFDKQYDEIIKTAYGENPSPGTAAKKRGRRKKGKVLNLIGRMEKYKASVCLFIKNPCVPFDNNQAERDLRMVKAKTKVSGCFPFVGIVIVCGTGKYCVPLSSPKPKYCSTKNDVGLEK